MELTNKNEIIPLLQKYGLFLTKRFGQNFLIDKNVLEKIVETAELKAEDSVVEIGPGIGVLTKELAKHAKKVITVELDKKLLPALKETLANHKNIEVVNIDALQFEPPKTKYKVVANIPYNITSPLINHFLRAENSPSSMTLLVQKEVAEKICERDGKTSILSLQVKLFGITKIISKVSKNSFFPAPKVDSAIIKINLYKKSDPEFIDKKTGLQILEIAKKAFSHKRKKLSTTLGHLKTSVDLNRRPETLSVKEWLEILKAI
jgi:16S rRNA (adenine1518-N6/adenine1519-N6)-dimethyltransferase